jgi:hypothetical protein
MFFFFLFGVYRHAVKTFGDYKYLGTRVQADGMIGEWVVD